MHAGKPRLKQLSRANWQCADAHLARCGRSAKQAYDRWLRASLREAMAWPAVSNGAKAKARGLALQVKTGKPNTAPVSVGVEISYPESVVRQVPGTAQRRSYVPPLELRMNGVRAAAHQPKLITPVGVGNGFETGSGHRKDQ